MMPIEKSAACHGFVFKHGPPSTFDDRRVCVPCVQREYIYLFFFDSRRISIWIDEQSVANFFSAIYIYLDIFLTSRSLFLLSTIFGEKIVIRVIKDENFISKRRISLDIYYYR